MRRFYQESWQGIPFTSFSHLSFFHLAEPRFYGAFYEELFRRYQGWENLPKAWRESKDRDAQWIAGQIREAKERDPDGAPPRVLSIGSGVGYMEKALLENIPDLELHVNEPSTVGMKWLRRHIPAERIYIGLPTVCIPPDLRFDLIYLSAVDYSIPNRDLVRCLEMLRGQLAPHGEVTCISASLLQEDSFVGGLVNMLKNVIRGFLHYSGVRRQQFWGWRRTQSEYNRIFRQAGFSHIEDGVLDDGFESYWIRGKR